MQHPLGCSGPLTGLYHNSDINAVRPWPLTVGEKRNLSATAPG